MSELIFVALDMASENVFMALFFSLSVLFWVMYTINFLVKFWFGRVVFSRLYNDLPIDGIMPFIAIGFVLMMFNMAAFVGVFMLTETDIFEPLYIPFYCFLGFVFITYAPRLAIDYYQSLKKKRS